MNPMFITVSFFDSLTPSESLSYIGRNWSHKLSFRINAAFEVLDSVSVAPIKSDTVGKILSREKSSK